MLHDKIKPIIITAAIIVVGILLFTFGNYVINRGKGTVTLNIVPSNVRLSVDGASSKSVKQNQSLKLAAGHHSLTFSQEGFKEATVELDVQAGSKRTVNAALPPANDQAAQQLSEAESLRGEGIASNQMDSGVTEINRKYPFVNSLPINRLLFSIYPGPSLLAPQDPTAVGIYIKAPTARARQDALESIRLKGYDPSDYEIIFNDEGRR